MAHPCFPTSLRLLLRQLSRSAPRSEARPHELGECDRRNSDHIGDIELLDHRGQVLNVSYEAKAGSKEPGFQMRPNVARTVPKPESKRQRLRGFLPTAATWNARP